MKIISLTLLGLAMLPIALHAGHHQPHEKKSLEQRAKSAVQKHLGQEVLSNFTVVEKREKNWSDTSLGCPRPGFNYPQMIVPGYQLIVETEGKTYPVHLSDKRAIICNKNTAPKAKPLAKGKPKKLKSLQIEQLTLDAKAHLAKTMGMNTEDVHLVSTKPVEWPNTSLGCPKPDMNYAQMLVKGYRITLEARNKQYTYHTDSTRRVIPCPNIAVK